MINQSENIILIPTYNEKENISVIIDDVFKVLPDTNILVIDDSSPDGTAQVVKNIMVHNKKVELLERAKKTGLGDAYKNGISHILKKPNIKTFVTMDADGSHSAEYLRIMLKEIEDNDLVIGSRYCHQDGVEGWEFWRRMLSKFGNIYSRMLIGMKIKDLTAGFVCAKIEMVKKINIDEISSAGYAYQIEFKYACSRIPEVKIKEIPIVFKLRREGESKISNQIIQEGLKTPIKIFLRRLWKK